MMAISNATTDTTTGGTHHHLNLVSRDEALRNTQSAPTDTRRAETQADSTQQSQNISATSTESDSPQHRPQRQADPQNPSSNNGVLDTRSAETSTEDPSISAIETQIAELLAAKSHLTMARPAHSSPLTLFTDESRVEAARAAAITATSSRDDRRPILPEIIPGFKSSALELPVPSCVKDAFRTSAIFPTWH
ncbi:hypothetical protein K439DRAFT_1631832 [Ramaria rubella]|nr:hypothetical protein K439DRAFT_1631832 [Ramaria rubella]